MSLSNYKLLLCVAGLLNLTVIGSDCAKSFEKLNSIEDFIEYIEDGGSQSLSENLHIWRSMKDLCAESDGLCDPSYWERLIESHESGDIDAAEEQSSNSNESSASGLNVLQKLQKKVAETWNANTGLNSVWDWMEMTVIGNELYESKQLHPLTILSILREAYLSPEKLKRAAPAVLVLIGKDDFFSCDPAVNDEKEKLAVLLLGKLRKDGSILRYIQYFRSMKEKDCMWLEMSPEQRLTDIPFSNYTCTQIFARDAPDVRTIFNSIRGILDSDKLQSGCTEEQIEGMNLFVEVATCADIECALHFMEEPNIAISPFNEIGRSSYTGALENSLAELVRKELGPQLEERANKLGDELDSLDKTYWPSYSRNEEEEQAEAFRVISGLSDNQDQASLQREFNQRLVEPCEKLLEEEKDLESLGTSAWGLRHAYFNKPVSTLISGISYCGMVRPVLAGVQDIINSLHQIDQPTNKPEQTTDSANEK